MTATVPLVRCADVGRTFGTGANAVVAVHDVHCSVQDGARIAVTGPSGSGKSSLVHMLAGLDRPTRGTVEWPAFGASPREDPTLVGVVFQGRSLIPALTALENVALPLVLTGIHQDRAEDEALTAMRSLGIEQFARQMPDELSGGQAQRIALARVLTTRPRLIIADEPTGRLDQPTAQLVVDVMLEAADAAGAAVVIATHDPHVSRRMSEVWRMRDGGMHPVGSPSTEAVHEVRG